MREPSRTAAMVASLRARSEHADDPFAHELAGDGGHADADAYCEISPHVELFIGLRTAFLDDAVRDAIDDGVRQVVLLGAGYDTRAARLAHAGTSFFEVDHPETQREKRRRMDALGGYGTRAPAHVPCDFETDDFVEQLARAGFDRRRPAVVVWEGVIYYLNETAARATLSRVAEALEPSSRLLFDYVGKRFVAGEVRDDADLEARAAVARMGEPLRYGVDDVLPVLYAEGFRHVRTTSFDAIALTYTGTYDRSRKMRFQAIAEARVVGPRGAASQVFS